MNPHEPVYRPEEIAEILRCTPQTVNAEIRRGKLKGFRCGRRNLITESALNEYMNRKEES